MEISDLSRQHKSILLYIETCLVDKSGLLEAKRMNSEDFKAMDELQVAGLIRYGRIPSPVLGRLIGGDFTHWASMSTECWKLVAAIRMERAVTWSSESRNRVMIVDTGFDLPPVVT